MNIREFLEKTDKDIRVMRANGLHYLSFFVMKDVITLLGTTAAPLDIEGDREMFNTALRTFPALQKYAALIGGPHDLYDGLGAHLKLGQGVVATQMDDPDNGDDHLRVLSFNGAPRLVLVCEELHGDIHDAIRDLDAHVTYADFMNPDLKAD